MLHAHQFIADLPPAIPPALRPGEYLRLRREAAGLSHYEVAKRIAPTSRTLQGLIHSLELVERPDVVILDRQRHEALTRLGRAFAFDADVYGQLADDPADRHPQVCRTCGCSHWDPCTSDIAGSCAWATPALCTACAPSGDDA